MNNAIHHKIMPKSVGENCKHREFVNNQKLINGFFEII